jgi:rhomboid protease GluP
MWGFAGPLRQLFRTWDFTNAVTVACVGLYVATLLVDPSLALRPRGILDVLAVSPRALWMFGAAGAGPWVAGHWWTILTAIYLHGSLLHILFNLLWIRQLAPDVEKIYGPARLVVIFTISGAAGFAASTANGNMLTVGASGSIFGLLGAIVAFGLRRGGVFGRMMFQQYGMWALILFLSAYFISHVDNSAHAGGFVGGFASGLVLSLAERRAETTVDWLLAIVAILLTVAGFVLALFVAFVD